MSGVDGMNYMYSLNANDGSAADDRRLRREYRSEHRPCPVPVARIPGGVPVADRREKLRPHGAEVPLGAARHLRPLLPQGDLRRHFPGQLRLHQPERPADPGKRDRKRHDLRRRSIRHAMLGAPGPSRQAQHHDPRNRRRAPETERRQPRRSGRRRTDPARTGVHLRDPGPGEAGHSGGVRPDRPASQPRRIDRASEGHRADRAGRAGLRHQREVQREAGGARCALPDSRLKRPGGGRGEQEGDGPAQGVVSVRSRLRSRARYHPLRHRGDP